MSTTKTLLCNCNRTMTVDAKRIAGALALETVPSVASELCRRQISTFEAAAKSGDDVLVACTQEAPLFTEVAKSLETTCELRFVNIRETAGWSAKPAEAAPKMAALIAAAAAPQPEPVPIVPYASTGDVLIIGDAGAALAWAEKLAGDLQVAVLITGRDGAAELPLDRRYPVYSGELVSLTGHLGAFTLQWLQQNPIDLDVCTRCGACARACPDGAIDWTFQVNLERCTDHRQCAAACMIEGALDFERGSVPRDDRFDLVLDLSREPILRMSQPPEGYRAPGADPLEQALAVLELKQLIGEFEKPRFVNYNERLCAHSRSGIVGCTQCLDVCSTAAIASDVQANRVVIDPHRCMGCGGCASVCPSGAITHDYPRLSDSGTRLRRALSAYGKAGGTGAAVLFHNGTDGAQVIARTARRGRGLPAHVIPVEVLHIASVGPDLLLGALALGATQVVIVAAGSEADEYRVALEREIAWCGVILDGLQLGSGRLVLLDAQDPARFEDALWQMPAYPPIAGATFNLSNEKRRTLGAAIDHLARQASAVGSTIPLPTGAPLGAVLVDRTACTLCMACVGACPANALLDSKETPALRFVERNCIQCGLCAKTCPEDAIELLPRLRLEADVTTPVVLNEAEPFHCVRCAKPFGTKQMVDGMLGRLSGHAMFGTPESLRRLQMCADCRVLDMMERQESANVFDYAGRGAPER